MGPIRKGVGRLVAAAAQQAAQQGGRPPLVVPFVHAGMEDVMPVGKLLPCTGQTGVCPCVVCPGVMCPGVHGVCLSIVCPGAYGVCLCAVRPGCMPVHALVRGYNAYGQAAAMYIRSGSEDGARCVHIRQPGKART
eukprot:1152579-Pelagomonas_calceolata.AAC.2